MSYEVSSGIPRTHLSVFLRDLETRYGQRGTGGINYRGQNLAAVVLCAVRYENEFLVVSRHSDRPGWRGFPSGYLDNPDWGVAEHAQDELKDEVGLDVQIEDIQTFDSYRLSTPEQPNGRDVLVFMANIVLDKRPELVINPAELVTGSASWEPEVIFPSTGMYADTPYAVDVALGRVKPGEPN
jgi:8-oxo-dGTP pyrophosphatase MutT (NUDIX family)